MKKNTATNNKEMNEAMNLNTSVKTNRRISRVSAMILSLTLTAAALPQQICSAEFYMPEYEIVTEGNLEFCRSTDMEGFNVSCIDKTAESVIVPAEVNGRPVTELAKEAFSECKYLKTIELPDTIKEIGDDAFYGTQWLEDRRAEDKLVIVNGILIDGANAEGDVVIPDTVTVIDDGAFFRNEKILTVQMPDTVTKAGADVFYECTNLKSVSVSNNLEKISAWMFARCSSLTSVNIPESVTEIEVGAFNGCTELEALNIPETVESIGGFAFADTRWLNNKVTENPLVVVNGILIDANEFKGSSVVIPDGVTTIGGRAFNYCNAVKNITIPSTVKLIDDEAFFGCTSLRTVDISDSVEEIGSCAFCNCSGLRNISIPASVKTIGNNVFGNCEALRRITINNPECDIDAGMSAPFGSAIYGHAGSTAEAYAAAEKLSFHTIDESETNSQDTLTGDANMDEAVTNADFVTCVLGIINGSSVEGSDCDINADGKVNAADLLLLKNILMA